LLEPVIMPTREALLQAHQVRIDELHRLEQGRTALLVIDMQHGFLDPGAALAVPQGRAIIPNLQLLVDACRQHQLPVIFTEFVYSTAIPCLRGDPFGPEHLPARPGQASGLSLPSSSCLIAPVAEQARTQRTRSGSWRPDLLLQGQGSEFSPA
jgi:nicotinamidase-related amidase